ncbi:uncharacterized protein N7500_006790 [Penicillium coprophilum]|uniref:uncharacterized protein n=1 Tax=Penicillium coprophilum TaxID=36646 RepID=UPI00239C6DF0|nr:uncharacterized protein N7500_006790 [Penicillium coprophilum]KAJ5164960.1 hypothetical protein N7500_006790 [Penicillium coprophilum]
MVLSDSEGSDVVMVSPSDVQDFNEENILPLPATDLKKIREWLQPTPYDLEGSEFSRHLESYLPGTGQWLISTDAYQRWHQSDTNGLLWIKGIPGSGKSVMAASIIHQLRKENVPVLFFFFRQIIDANHQPVAVLRDWLCQLIPFSPSLQAKLKKDYLDKRFSVDSVAANDLWKSIRFALTAFPKAYCIVDALDEMDQGNDDFLQALVELGQWRPANLKVLMLSRPVVAVEAPLRLFPVPVLHMDDKLVDIDIAAYVQHRLRNLPVPEEYWTRITEAVPGRANGLFLYARLSMDAFSKPGAVAGDVLNNLPINLNVMYDRLLREHSDHSNVPKDLQMLILQSITHATRPLRLLEVAEMIKATYTPLETSSLKEIKNFVRAACGPLLQILHDETVSVVHHSLTEFLKGLTRSTVINELIFPILEAGPTNHRLAVACLDYLMCGCLESINVKKRKDSDNYYNPKKAQQIEIRLKFPFLEYAANNWYIHTRRAALTGMDLSSLYSVIDEFFESKKQFIAWLDIDWPQHSLQGVTPLHAAAKAGLAQYAAHLFQKGNVDPSVKTHNGDTPLYWAAFGGHGDVAQILIQNGADPDGEANQGYKPLHEAARKNHADVVKTLLAAGVDPMTPKTQDTPGRRCGNAPTSVGHTPLMYACRKGHLEAVTEFLPYLSEANIEKALNWLSGSGHATCVSLVLQNSVVDMKSHFGGGLLFEACLNGDLDTIKVLVEAGADPNTRCLYPVDEFGGIGSRMHIPRKRKTPGKREEPRGFTALHALSGIKNRIEDCQDSLECVSVLLQAGADVHTKSENDGKTALHFACANNINIVPLLLEAGADPYAKTDSGATILHTDGKTDQKLLPILIDSAAVDINRLMAESNGGPLFSRLRGYNSESVIEILKYIMDPNLTEPDGNSFLHVFLDQYPKDTVLEALLSAGADPNLQNNKGETPLHIMRDDTKLEIISKLVKAGADLEIRDLKGQTTLFRNLSRYSGDMSKISKSLIDLGARLDTRDNKGRTLFHILVCQVKALDILIKMMDFDPSVADNEGNTLFLELAFASRRWNSPSNFKHLKSLGVDIDRPNSHGWTVLHQMSFQNKCDRRPSVETPFEYVLRECKNKGPRDIDGIQPLHIAAAVSEDNVFGLLCSGADMFAFTKEGMTVLHVAARARKPGIVGLLLSRMIGLDDETRNTFINQKNVEGDTALHFACCSGRPETVDLLLNAGADPTLPGKDGYTPLRACVNFEMEQVRWQKIGKIEDVKALKTASIWLGIRSLPPAQDDSKEGSKDSQWRSNSGEGGSSSTRLDEILTSLVLHSKNLSADNDSLREAFQEAVSNQRDYTAECLLRLQNRVFPNMNLIEGPGGNDFVMCNARLQAEISSLRKEEKRRNEWMKTNHGSINLLFLQMVQYLRLRQYGLFEELASQTDPLELDYTHISIVHCLVDDGLSELLDRLCTPEQALKFDDHEWCEHTENSCSRSGSRIRSSARTVPLLMHACHRNLPNMKVVRTLVENLGVNIDAKRREERYVDDDYVTVLDHAVLHDLAKGETWWNVHQALPYLISKGADLEVRNDKGETPLHIALDYNKSKGVFYKDAVDILLNHGADVNAVSASGETCLSKAGADIDLIKLLLSRGAAITATAIFAAIDFCNVELLELYLSRSDVANMRRPAPKSRVRPHPRADTIIPAAEEYPVFYAATSKSLDDVPCKEFDIVSVRKDAMTALLRNGADPYATFVELHRVKHDSFSDGDDSDSHDLHAGSKDQWEPETLTVIHEILTRTKVFEPLLQLADLQLECRDDKGRTLILCTSKPEAIRQLVDRGADITAQDKSGKTVAHALIACQATEDNISIMRALFDQNPSIVQLGDEAGDTPLHYALRKRWIQFEHVDLLLEYGADLHQPDSNGDTVLHILCTRASDNKTRIEHFLALGLDINARNKKGDTPLMHCLAKGRLRSDMWSYIGNSSSDNDNLRLLQDLGVDFHARNHAGMSMLHVVAGRKVHDTLGVSECDIEDDKENLVSWFNFIMGLGVDPMLEDAQQRTSLDHAAACGNEHILKLFKHKNAE